MEETVLDVLRNAAIIPVNILQLPTIQLDRKTYLKVEGLLELIGGKWDRHKKGFVFKTDPTPLLEHILGGQAPLDFKKEYQYFPTPTDVGEKMLNLLDLKSHHKVLEPSAGQGHLTLLISAKFPRMQIDCYEIFEPNRVILSKQPNVNLFSQPDFLTGTENLGEYDRILANPPFSKNRDIRHIYRMYENLKKDGGRLVSLSGPHWKLSNNNIESRFRDWLEKVGAEFYEIESGSFKETKVQTTIIAITK